MANRRKIYLGSDHAGYQLKKELIQSLPSLFPDLDFEDLGCDTETSCDYPKFAGMVGAKVSQETSARGILVCGSGIGMAIAANKVKGVRAANVWDVTSARLSRQHNDSNVVCFGSRLTGKEVAIEACRTWLTTNFDQGRHQRRIDLLSEMEK